MTGRADGASRVGRTALALLLGAVLGLAAGYGLWHRPVPFEEPRPRADAGAASGSEAASAPLREIVVLRERLAAETAERQALERLLAEAGADPPVDAAAGPGVEESAGLEVAESDGAGEAGQAPWVDDEVLARAGFAPSEVELLQTYFEAIELDRLYLRDRAVREGWKDEPRFRQSMLALDMRAAKLRSEYGDDAYDWILYASKRPNRVVVQRVMEGSQAEAVGLQEGDVFLEYDGERVFGVPALRNGTTKGAAGESVEVEVERDGSRLRVFPERGPLGVALGLDSREPERPAY